MIMKKVAFISRFRSMTVLLLLLLSTLANAQTPYALWLSGPKTLYFTCTTKVLKSGDTFAGSTITNVWKGDMVVNTGVQPQWNPTVRSDLREVVIDSLFKNALPASTRQWFYRCKKLKRIEGLEYLNTSAVTSMSEMFRECDLLEELDVSNFKTENVEDMGSLFRGCIGLKSLDVSWFNTWQTENMSHMFEGCTSLESITFHTLLNHTFLTNSVSDMSSMFYDCSSLKSLDLTEFLTGNVTNMSYMFSGCKSLTSLDLRNFNTKKVTNMTHMFSGCTALQTIKCNDSWSADSSLGMFLDCENLSGAIPYDQFKLDVAYANPSDGYFYYYKDYPIYINGTQVDNTNNYDLTRIKGVTLTDSKNGKASYDQSTKTLCLRDVRITSDAECALRNEGVDGLTVEISGIVFIDGETTTGIQLEQNTTLTVGSSKQAILDVNAKGIGLSVWATAIVEGGLSAHFNGGAAGIFGGFAPPDWTSLRGSLIVRGATTVVTAYGKLLYSIGLLPELILEDGLDVVSPAGARYQQSGGTTGVVISDGTDFVKDKAVTIEHPDAPVYDISILGKQVSHHNCEDLTVIDGVSVEDSGYAKYDPASNTLTLKDCSIQGTAAELVSCRNHGLKINLEGKNYISSTDLKEHDGLCIHDRTTLTGDGELLCRGGNLRAGIYITDTLTVESGTLGGWGLYGILGQKAGVSSVVRGGILEIPVGNGKVRAYGTESSIHHLIDVRYGGDTRIVSPEDARYNYYDAVGYDNSVVKNEEVVIETPLVNYGIIIAGIELTNQNLGEITKLVASLDAEAWKRYERGVMQIAYKPESKFLTLKNVIIKADGAFVYGLQSNLDDLTVNLVGDNMIESKLWDGMCSSGLTLMGGGSLSVKGEKGLDLLGYDMHSLVISDGVKVSFDGSRFGIAGSGLYGPGGMTYYTDMEVRGKYTVVRAYGQDSGIHNLRSLTLSDGLAITLPAGAAFEYNSVCLDGYPVRNEYVEISAAGSGKKGDVNRDGNVDISDIVAVINCIAGDTTYITTADVNADNHVDISDIVAIINVIAGM